MTLLYMPDEPTKLRNYAFINFLERAAATKAVAEAEANPKKHILQERELLVGVGRRGREGGGMEGERGRRGMEWGARKDEREG